MLLRGLGATAIEYGLVASAPSAVLPRTVGVSPGTYTIRTRGLRDITDSPPTVAGMRLDILGVLLAAVVTTTIIIAKSAK